MNTTYREILISLLLGGISLLIAFLLFLLLHTQLISFSYGWMLLFLTILLVVPIGCLIAVLLIVLRDLPKIRNFSIRMTSLAVGLLFLSMVGFGFTAPTTSPKELLSTQVLLGCLFFPVLMLSAFGLFIDVWLSRSLGVSQRTIYRYAIRLCCISMALTPILTLMVDNPVGDFRKDFQIIRHTLPFVSLSILLFRNSEKYLRDQ